LLFCEEDADLLFGLRARGQLSEQDLRNVFTVVRGVRDRVHRSTTEEWFWASPEEIGRDIGNPEDADLAPEQRDTRLRVAIHLLEDFGMLERDVNLSSRIRFDLAQPDAAEAEKHIRGRRLGVKREAQLVRLARAMHALRLRPALAEGPLPTDLLCD